MSKYRLYLLISTISIAIFGARMVNGRDIKLTTINILMPAPFADSTSKSIERFNNTHKGNIKIKVTKGPRETESVSDLAISNLLLGNSTYDIILMDVTWLPKYASAGWLMPLDSWFVRKDLKELAPGARLGNRFKNKLYRWPLVADMGLLYWRKDLMSSPPKTPYELIKLTEKLISQGKVKYGYVWQGRQYEGLSCVFLELIEGFGGKWLSKTNEVGLNNKEAKEVASWLRDLIERGITPASVTNFSEPEALQAFKSGEAALMRNWPYAYAELQKEDSNVKNKIGITTMISKKGGETTSTLGSWGFVVLKTSKHPDKAIKVIKFLTSETSQRDLFISYGYTPTKASLYKDKNLLETSPILPELARALEATKPRPETPFYAQLSDILQRELSSILTGQNNVEDAMNNAHSKTVKILRSSGAYR